ncbi:MAG: selenium cofactor biosynthesis protein YqeC [Myxococcota bacterium]|nr:selenium cofactor biosynthesis protein YqeC [Myxococcota bacterium]
MQAARLDLPRALGLGEGPLLLSIVGGGGKSSLLFSLGERLPGRVLLTTTTRIFAAQMELAQRVFTLGDPDWREGMAHASGPTLLVGHVEGERAVGVPPELPQELLEQDEVDWVVVEADGSRMRPTKAPADHEPVIPPKSGHVIVVAGIDALTAPIEEITHRPERVSEITGLPMSERLSPEALAALLSSSKGGLKNVPPEAEVSVLLNKVEDDQQRAWAEEIAEKVLQEKRVHRVLAGRLKPTPTASWQVWSQPD